MASYDGYNSYLIIADEASRHTWVFLFKSKEPPLNTAHAFLERFGIPKADGGGFIRTDQGGELARSHDFVHQMLKDHGYVVEPTGSDSPSQNGGAGICNKTLGVTVRTLLYGAGLHAKFWSAALLHAVYLNNRRVHSAKKITPIEAWTKSKPNLNHLKIFGSRVCVKRTGNRRAKLDMHNFRGIFLGYTATDENIPYIDLDTGVVKTCHHATFDEAWYLQPQRPPVAQLLYDLGLKFIDEDVDETSPLEMTIAPYPPLLTTIPSPPRLLTTLPNGKWGVPTSSKMLHLPLRLTSVSSSQAATAARVQLDAAHESLQHRHDEYEEIRAPILDRLDYTAATAKSQDRSVVDEFHVTQEDPRQVYLSPTHLNISFEETIDLRKFDLDKHLTAGMHFTEKDDTLLLIGMAKSTPAAKIPRWRSQMRGAYLLKVNGTTVKSIKDVESVLRTLSTEERQDCVLILSHPEIRHGLSSQGIPIMSEEEFTQ